MLRKAATGEGKDWDKLHPFLLFAYREVPQSTTGFAPFELVYGRHVRGPLDVLRDSWEADKRSTESIVSYVLLVQERLKKMQELVRQNVEEAARNDGMTEEQERGSLYHRIKCWYYYQHLLVRCGPNGMVHILC